MTHRQGQFDGVSAADVQNRGWADAYAAGAVDFNKGKYDVENAKAQGLPAAQADVAADFDGDGKVDLSW
ncbi:MAG: hypothetical protein R2748_10175 [Bryobacterales bacterium]